MYIAQLRLKRANPGMRLIDTTFQAWELGPVSPEVYKVTRVFGSDAVKNVFHSISDAVNPLDADLYETVSKMSGKTPGELVAITHRTGGAWALYFRPGVFGVRIPDAAIDAEAETFSTLGLA
jgi:uncharacterized phage-associated protein